MNGFNLSMLGLAGIAAILFLLLMLVARRMRSAPGSDPPAPASPPADPITATASMRATPAATSLPPFTLWRLLTRNLANPGSAGGPLYRLRIVADHGLPLWRPGAVAHVYCGPAEEAFGAAGTARAPIREYLVGSLPAEGAVDLVVRLREDPDGGGSRWLCTELQPGQEIAVALRDNPDFAPPADDVPLILIGNATGLAGLHAHIKARPPGSRNWLIFGDRKSADDAVLAAQITEWMSSGHLERCDLVLPGEGRVQRRVVNQMNDASETLLDWALAGAAIYVCGSKPMGDDVHAVLIRLFGAEGVEAMAEEGLYRRSLH